MSCDILTLSMSPSAFSLGSQILDDKLLSMSHENLEMTVYFKYWYHVEDRQQNNLRDDRSSLDEESEN